MARNTSPNMSPGDCIAFTLSYGSRDVLVPKKGFIKKALFEVKSRHRLIGAGRTGFQVISHPLALLSGKSGGQGENTPESGRNVIDIVHHPYRFARKWHGVLPRYNVVYPFSVLSANW